MPESAPTRPARVLVIGADGFIDSDLKPERDFAFGPSASFDDGLARQVEWHVANAELWSDRRP
jgi:hypothetical protein